MSKDQKGLSAAVLMGLFVAITNSSGAIAVPVPQAASLLESVNPMNTTSSKTYTKDFTYLQPKLNATVTNASLLSVIPSASVDTDFTQISSDAIVSPSTVLESQVSQTTVSPTASPEATSEPISPTPQEIPSPSQNPEPTPEQSSPNLQTNPESQPAPELQITNSEPTRWHFQFEPYIYIPFTIYGNSTVLNRRGGDGDFAVDPGQIRTFLTNDLNFAFLGDFQAWSPSYHWGVVTNIDYLSTSSNSTFTRSLRFPGLADFIPTELRSDLDVNFWSVDLAAVYRIYNPSKVNSEGVATEFDLGPFVVDIIGGANFTSLDENLSLRTNLGKQTNFDNNVTFFSPLLGVNLRTNVSQNFALVAGGSVSGFGINGLTRWSARAGLDWMFSGNTSLGLGYRFGHVDYSDNDFELSLNQNGPYLNLSFRF